MKKWNRALGTSKREQGIVTAPAPQHPRRRLMVLTGKVPLGVKMKTGMRWVTEETLKKILQRFKDVKVVRRG